MPRANAAPPAGFRYVPELVTPEAEAALILRVEDLELEEVRMHGVAARRTVAHFGYSYAYDSARISPGPPLPEAFHELRARAAELLSVDPNRLREVLVSRYPEGAGIGWHRDAPAFARLVGVSLGSECVLRFRRRDGSGWARFSQCLAPRSAYVIAGEARSDWQHSIPSVDGLRYSITFRTLRRDERETGGRAAS